MTENRKREAAHALMEMCLHARRCGEMFSLCSPCPFPGKKCREISTADWLRWLDGEEQETETDPEFAGLTGGELYAAIISEARWAEKQLRQAESAAQKGESVKCSRKLETWDKMVARMGDRGVWSIDLFSHIETEDGKDRIIVGMASSYTEALPYIRGLTDHLIGTRETPPDIFIMR